MGDASLGGVTMTQLSGEGAYPEITWPVPYRHSSNSAMMAGYSGGIIPGRTVHQDAGSHESGQQITIHIPHITDDKLAALFAAYAACSSDNPITFSDGFGNSWECVFAPGAAGFSAQGHGGFSSQEPDGVGHNKVTMVLSVIRKV